MREMKDSGTLAFGTIPSTWKITKFKNLFFLRSTKNTGNRELLSVYLDKGVISYSDSDGMQVHKPSESLAAYQNVEIGDFVLNNQQAWRGSVGVSKYHGIISPAYFVYSMTDECYAPYMNYLLRDSSMVHQYELASRGVGTIQRNLFAPWLKNSIVLIPPICEQKVIANFLDSQCSEIDAISADIQKEIEILEQYKRSVITEAVTKGLNPDVEMKDSGIEWVGNVPDHWGVLANKYVMKKRKDICTKWNGENVLSLTMNGVIVRDLDNPVGKMPTTFDGYQFVYSGNLLMCLFDYDVTPRCVGIVKNDGVTSPAYSRFELKENATLEYFYYYYLMIDFTKELLHLAKNLRHSFTEEQLGALKVPLPPLDEQKNIATYLDSKCKEIESVIASKKQQLEVLDSYKKSLIYEYVTGKKEVPAQN
ncbi:MAG: restriction endonuclease subunit S [Gemmiger sp.]|uniref:restriction endonuclease subunit S n=1 Tax=Gemmiger sp. TaxID=2049027 RepID=UPI002A91F348|nr:restriction endonuclease subunit S [Gemmiger sp.]MDY5410616.1 restriction endonuclease subunit S [Gemmiger sp.]